MLEKYKALCQLDTIALKAASKYPYAIQENIKFTLHEVNVEYKKNYCQETPIAPNGGNNYEKFLFYLI